MPLNKFCFKILSVLDVNLQADRFFTLAKRLNGLELELIVKTPLQIVLNFTIFLKLVSLKKL